MENHQNAAQNGEFLTRTVLLLHSLWICCLPNLPPLIVAKQRSSDRPSNHLLKGPQRLRAREPRPARQSDRARGPTGKRSAAKSLADGKNPQPASAAGSRHNPQQQDSQASQELLPASNSETRPADVPAPFLPHAARAWFDRQCPSASTISSSARSSSLTEADSAKG